MRFWGTRGSLAKPGADTQRYGGNTSCVEIRSASGTLVVIDCGTGAHDLGQSLKESTSAKQGHLLISHTHWDHIQGIPFFDPFFQPDNEWDIYAPHSLSQSLRDTLAGQMRYTYFPVTLEALGAKIHYHDLVEGTFEVGDITVRARFLNHTALTLGYRLEVDGCVVVYSCDHEPFAGAHAADPEALNGQNQRHAEFLRDADLVIHDAQYTAAEYPEKIGWGHSTGEYAVAVCVAAGVRQLALTHHDPLRSDNAVDAIVANLQNELATTGQKLQVFGAAEGKTIQLARSEAAEAAPKSEWFSAVEPVIPAISEHSVLLGATDDATRKMVTDAAEVEGLKLISRATNESAQQALESGTPSVVLLDASSPLDELLEICRAVRERASETSPQAPIVVITDEESIAAELDACATDKIRRPFSPEYIRTRLRAWILRSSCRWIRARRPDDEEVRLAALNSLKILDTEPEERFDRIVRLAADVLQVPIALVSLIDRDRQWFKSCIGLDSRETPRDMAFCAHAILEKKVMVVPDTFMDPRFADNPLVTGDLRIRFYAGCPIRHADGHMMGTLCLIDTRPRQFNVRQINQLKEFARLVEQQLGSQ
ncbi:MAG: GAF domain-containing protein [Gammaproteobacteria bacterium]|nr:GAF domain-containing protein [Gammaproteobacteria bacterium]